mmetsp:Transcript_53454/g.109033  ORF Transcript_53454/g.109033 Transcript_53454/m.109033 type:complete len:239 (-) Transcript_53454:720-1436(-)
MISMTPYKCCDTPMLCGASISGTPSRCVATCPWHPCMTQIGSARLAAFKSTAQIESGNTGWQSSGLPSSDMRIMLVNESSTPTGKLVSWLSCIESTETCASPSNASSSIPSIAFACSESVCTLSAPANIPRATQESALSCRSSVSSSSRPTNASGSVAFIAFDSNRSCLRERRPANELLASCAMLLFPKCSARKLSSPCHPFAFHVVMALSLSSSSARLERLANCELHDAIWFACRSR